MKFLLVRLGALGDVVHGLPVAAALRRRHPDARIDWLVDARHAALLELVPAVSRIVRVDSRRWAAAARAVRALRGERYDAAVDMQGLLKSALFARLSGAARVIGFDRSAVRERPASWLYSERCHPVGAHVVDKNLCLLAHLGIDERLRCFPVEVPESAAAAVVTDRAARDGRRGCALLNPGAAWPNKRWPPERFGEVAGWLAAAHGLHPVVLWGPGERELAEGVVRASGGAAVIAPQTGVGDLLALSRGARLIVSGDTGPLHLAAAVGTPVVALFGPTDAGRNGPWDEADVSLSRFGGCVCHYRRRCRRSRACIDEISVEDVRGAIDRRLAAAGHHA